MNRISAVIIVVVIIIAGIISVVVISRFMTASQQRSNFCDEWSVQLEQ